VRHGAISLAFLLGSLLGTATPPTVEAQQPGVSQQPAAAQPSLVPQRPWTLTPSLDVAERFDDNVFLTAQDQTSDFVTEFTPRLSLEYQSSRVNLLADYAVVAQYYAETTDLNNVGDNQRGVLTLRYEATPELLLTVGGYYVRSTETTSAFARPTVPETVIVLPTSESERRLTQEYSLTASGSYRFDRRTTGTATYSFAGTDQEGTPATYSNSVGLGMAYALTSLDSLLLNASAALYSVSSGESDQESYAFTAGWKRQWTPSLTTSLAVGPEVTDDDVGGTATAAVSYQLTRELLASLTYRYGTGVVVGEVGAQQASALGASLSYQPRSDLQILLSGGWTKSFPIGGSFDGGTDDFFAGLTARYHVTRWLSTYLSYHYSRSEPATTDSITNNQVSVGVTFSYPFFF
jgi:hypothetical protein